jgi:hypothetical protein
MKSRYLIFLIVSSIFLFAFSEKQVDAGEMYKIPTQKIDSWQVMNEPKRHDTITVDSFEISPLVTFGEYREYLVAIKKDSSLKFYQSQFPDSAMCAADAYSKYVNTSAYDNFPVSGISWDNALNFCKWKTVNANLKDSFNIIYTLPRVSEWIAAYEFLEKKQIVNDFNKDYSDWTLSMKDESYYDFMGNKTHPVWDLLDYEYWTAESDAPVLKRKIALGNSFHSAAPTFFGFFDRYYYEFHGYAYVGFRYVRKKIIPLIPDEKSKWANYTNWDDVHDLLYRWGLIKQMKLKKNNTHETH